MTSFEDRRRLLRAALAGAGAALTRGLPLATGSGGRELLARAAVSAAALGGAAGVRPVLAQPGALATVPLRGDLALITGAGGNVVLMRAPGGAAMVDSGAPDHAADLVRQVDDHVGGEPIGVLFNTHWHPAHTGANDAYGAAGARIVAHENTRLWMSTEYYVDWQDRTYEPRAPEALPNDTFYSSDPQPIVVELGDEEIEYGHLREAHTDGDIYVRFRAHDVIVAGGAATVGAYPVLDYATGGWIGGLVDATEKLLALAGPNTLIVPQIGPAQPRAHLEKQLKMLSVVRERIENLMRAGRSAEEMLAAGVTAEFDAEWGRNAERFVSNIYGGLWWVGRLTDSL